MSYSDDIEEIPLNERPYEQSEPLPFVLRMGQTELEFEDLEVQGSQVKFKSRKFARILKMQTLLLILILVWMFFLTTRLVSAAEMPRKEDYYHRQRKPNFERRQETISTLAPTPSEVPGNSTPPETNPDVIPQKCSNQKEGNDCSVLADFKTSAIILSGDQVSFVEGGCGQPLPVNPKGLYKGLVPCDKGQKLNWGDCEFFACEQSYGDPIDNTGTFETSGNQIIFTCRGEGTFILLAPDKNINVNYKILFQFSYFAPEGLIKLKWSCGTGLTTTDFYTPKIALCKKTKTFSFICLNKHLEEAALAFGLFLFFTSMSVFELFDPFAWLVTLVLIIPFIYFYYRAHNKSITEVAMEYMKLTGQCPLCKALVSDPKYHVEHCPKNLKGELSEKDLRSWLFFRRILHWGHKVAFWLELSILLLLLIFAVSNVDTVGAIDVSTVLDAPSTDCPAFEVGASDAVATFINGRTCSGTTCTGTVDIDSTLQGVDGFTQRFSLGDGLFFDIRIASVFYTYTVSRQYDTCNSVILQSSTSSCGGDGCDVCNKKITNYLLFTDTPGTNEWACDGGCIRIQSGCTCASCTHQKTDGCYMVGQSTPKDLILNLQLQSGGTCKAFSIAMNSKSNKVLITQLSEENKMEDMVAVKDNKVYQGAINKIGEFGGFGDLKFKSDTDLECRDNQKWNVHCKFGHTKTYIYTSCCSDTYSLNSQLQVRADWKDNSWYELDQLRVGTFRAILTIPDVPIARNPEDVSLLLNCKITEGCYSCASGAKLQVDASATGPGWFDVAVEGGNIRPNQLNVNSGPNTAYFTIYLGFKTGSVKINFGPYSCSADYNLADPGSDTTDVSNPNVNNIPGDTCGFICGLSNFFHLPTNIIKFFLKGLALLITLAFILIAIMLIRRAYRYEKAHHKEKAINTVNKKSIEQQQQSYDRNEKNVFQEKGSPKRHIKMRKSQSLQDRTKGESNEPIMQHKRAASELKDLENDHENHQDFLAEVDKFKNSPDYKYLTMKEKIELQMLAAKHKKST